MPVKCIKAPPPWHRLLFVLRRWFCCCWHFVYCYSHCGSLYCSVFCYALRYVHSSIAIILMGKRELVALLNLSSWCLMMVEWLFGSSSRCHGVVCGYWLWYFLIILTYYFWISCDSLHAFTDIAMVLSFIVWSWDMSQTRRRPLCKAFIGWLLTGACLLPGPPWLNLVILALTIRESCALFFLFHHSVLI